MEFYIMCETRTKPDGIAAWWRPQSCGYTTELNDAGRYSENEARSIVDDAGDAIMIPVSMIDEEITTKRIVDIYSHCNYEKIKAYSVMENSDV